MPTNEERRNVAARLREMHGERQGTFEPQSMYIQAMNRLDDLLECLPKRRDMFIDLSDLIEPEPERTCRNTTRHRYYGFECSECKWSAYEPNDYGNDVRFDDFNYCPHCGAKVVSDD